jgi:hypothetical protein
MCLTVFNSDGVGAPATASDFLEVRPFFHADPPLIFLRDQGGHGDQALARATCATLLASILQSTARACRSAERALGAKHVGPMEVCSWIPWGGLHKSLLGRVRL